MKRRVWAGALALVAGAMSAGSALAQEIILFEHANYQGRQIRVSEPVDNLTRAGFNDLASSFRIVSGEWEVCQHDRFNGTCETHGSDQRSLGRMNDQITSLRPVVPAGAGGGESITLYSGFNYTGRSVTLRESTSDFSRISFNDQARSVRHSGRRSWRLCDDANFGGACMEVSGDIAQIGGGMAGRISSAEPDFDNRPGYGGGSRPTRGVNLYDGVNFTGQRLEIGGEERNLNSRSFNDRADSLSVAPGEIWLACEDANFGGRCAEIEGEVADLTRHGLRNAISSMRRIDGSWGGPTYPVRGIEGGVRGADALFFGRPEIDGYAVDSCLTGWGGRCGAEAAEAMCQAEGFRQARHWAVDRYSRARTWHLTDNRACTGNCAPLVDVLCTN
ncbi:beta/gamma crystallin-related protein [Maricaulis sp. CAU 1757]